MSRHKAYRTFGGQLVVDLQSDLTDTGMRVVAPLVPENEGGPPVSRLQPVFEIAGIRMKLRIDALGAVPTRVLGRHVTDLAGEHDRIRNALDTLFSGF